MPHSDPDTNRCYMRDYMRRRRAGEAPVKPDVKPIDDEELTRLRDENAALRAIVNGLEAEVVKLKNDLKRSFTAEEYRLITSVLHSDSIAFLNPPPELVAKFDRAFIAFREREGAKQEEKKKADKMWADMREGAIRRRAENVARGKKAAATRKARAEAAVDG